MSSGHHAYFRKKKKIILLGCVSKRIIFVSNVLCDASFGREQVGRTDGKTNIYLFYCSI